MELYISSLNDRRYAIKKTIMCVWGGGVTVIFEIRWPLYEFFMRFGIFGSPLLAIYVLFHYLNDFFVLC